MDGLDLSEEALEVARREANAAGFGDRLIYQQADLNGRARGKHIRHCHRCAGAPPCRRPERLLDQSLDPSSWCPVRRPGIRRAVTVPVAGQDGGAQEPDPECPPAGPGSTPCAGEVKERLVRPSPGDIIAADPSRGRTLGRDSGAPQSPVLTFSTGRLWRHAAPVSARGYRGELQGGRPQGRRASRSDVTAEEVLIAERVLPSDFAFFVLSPR